METKETKIKEEIDDILRQMCFGRSRREYSDDMIERIYQTSAIEENCVLDDIIVDQDIIITALMEIVFNLAECEDC